MHVMFVSIHNFNIYIKLSNNTAIEGLYLLIKVIIDFDEPTDK